MDPKNLQNFHKFFNNSRKLGNFNKFLSPAQNSGKYRKFLPTEQIWQKFPKFFSPHKIDRNFSFCPHKFERILQVFVPLAKLRDKIFRPQKCTSRIVTGGDAPRDKA